jgi:hypothetical protein
MDAHNRTNHVCMGSAAISLRPSKSGFRHVPFPEQLLGRLVAVNGTERRPIPLLSWVGFAAAVLRRPGSIQELNRHLREIAGGGGIAPVKRGDCEGQEPCGLRLVWANRADRHSP